MLSNVRNKISLGEANRTGLNRLLDERSTRAALIVVVAILLLGVFGPHLAPYEPDTRHRGDDGSLLRAAGPSLDHPLGTTDGGYDVFSRVLFGARPTMLAGLIGGTMIISIGMFVGLTSGYVGGRVDEVFMRVTDVVYAVPLIPFALVLVAIIGIGFYQSVIVIGLVLWRGNARVLRSQTLQIRERPFILSAKASGAGTPYIIVRHILPNVLPMAFLFFALGTGYTIVLQAGLAFLGVSDPSVPSWGIMIRNAYNSGMMTRAWWWAITPGLLLAVSVLSLFLLGRGYEEIASDGDGEDGEAIFHAG